MGGLERRVDALERSVSDLQNDRNTQKDIIDVKSSAMTKIENITEHQRISESVTDLIKVKENDSELVEKYTAILVKIEKMENLLGLHSQSITDFSRRFPGHLDKDNQKETLQIRKETLKEIKSEKLESSSYFEVHSRELVDKNLATDIILLKAEVGNIKNKLERYNIVKDDPNFLTNCENHNNIFEFLEILVGMNKSLNEMMEDFVKSQTQVQLMKTEQEQFISKMKEEREALETHFDNDKDIIKIGEHEKISQKLDDMGNMLHTVRKNIDELQKIHNINKCAKKAQADDFSIDGSMNGLKNKGEYFKIKHLHLKVFVSRVEQFKTGRKQ